MSDKKQQSKKEGMHCFQDRDSSAYMLEDIRGRRVSGMTCIELTFRGKGLETYLTYLHYPNQALREADYCILINALTGTRSKS
jgi:hypothetical protein